MSFEELFEDILVFIYNIDKNILIKCAQQIGRSKMCTERVCIGIDYLRKKYNDKNITLEKWLQDPNNVYVGRRGRIFITDKDTGEKKIFHYKDSVWRNEFTVKDYGLEDCLRLFNESITKKIEKGEVDLESIRGKKLGCFCKPGDKCHIDILIKKLKN